MTPGPGASGLFLFLPDPVVLTAVNEIESLTVGLSRKIWQKIMILDTMPPRVSGSGEG